ncbi:hypothetical protein AB0M22_44340 [Nocardia sp. NPDC051756]|uniref:hypothetical protein n=1 Tax=Nocardia sp. NPDC051756 TaxID=3154751 RepID=UPI0034256084
MSAQKLIRSIRTPRTEVVRARLADWTTAYPDDVRVRLLDEARGRTGRPAHGWEDAFLRAMVSGSEERCPDDGSLDPGGSDLGGLPFRLTLGRDWALFQHSHALGDGTPTWDFLGMLLASAGPRRHRAAPVTAGPLSRGLLTAFGRSRSRLSLAITVQRELRQLRTPGARAAVDSGPGAPTFAVTAAASSDSFIQQVREMRAARGSTASVMSIVTLRALLLCRHHGLDVDDTMVFMVDLRRYLAVDAVVEGNFSWSKSVPILDTDTPAQLSTRIGRILDSGLPLLTFGDALQRFVILHSGRPPARGNGDRVRMMMSFGTRWSTVPPPAGPEPPLITVSIAPPGPNFVGFNIVEAYGRMHVSLNRSAATLDRVVAERIATDLVADLGTGPVDETLWAR